jgi:hypothetical protein
MKKENLFSLIAEECVDYGNYLLKLKKELKDSIPGLDRELEGDGAFIMLRIRNIKDLEKTYTSQNLVTLKENFQYLQQIEFNWFKRYWQFQPIRKRIETKAIDKYKPNDLNPEIIAERMSEIEREKYGVEL